VSGFLARKSSKTLSRSFFEMALLRSETLMDFDSSDWT
jgi:hypothetical protein